MKKRINKERKKENPDKAKIAKLNTELNFANVELEMLTQATNDQIEQAAEEERLRKEDTATEEARKKAEKEVMSTFNSVWGDRYDNNFQNEARGLLKKYAHVPGVVDALADPQAKNERTEDEVAAGVLGSIRISMVNTNAQGEADKGGINAGVLSNTGGNGADWKDFTRFGKFFTYKPADKQSKIFSWGGACDLIEQACQENGVVVNMNGNDALMTMLSQAAQFGEAQGQTAAAGISNYILAKRIEQAREAARQWDSDNEQYREQNTLYSAKQNEKEGLRVKEGETLRQYLDSDRGFDFGLNKIQLAREYFRQTLGEEKYNKLDNIFKESMPVDEKNAANVARRVLDIIDPNRENNNLDISSDIFQTFGAYRVKTSSILPYLDYVEDALPRKYSSQKTEENVRFAIIENGIGRSLTADEAMYVISNMEKKAIYPVRIELTEQNWLKEFEETGIISTPIGDVKFGDNQFSKMNQKDRITKLGMIKPTLQNPDFIVEDKRLPKDGSVPNRETAFVFVKSFLKEDGSRLYYFASVTVKKGNNEVIISNQEKSKSRIKRLLVNGKLAYINNSTLPSESNTSTQGDKPVNHVGGISGSKGTINSRTDQTNSEKNSENLQDGEDVRFSVTPEQDAEYMRAVESGDTEKAGQMVKAAFKAKYPESVYETTEFLHGSKNKFTEFKDTQKNDAGWLGKGFYFFGNNPVYASQYGENIYKSFLNIENPYYISNEEYNNLAEKNNNEYSSEFTERIREEGYDAVVREPDLDFEVVVFEPNQIKSADPITYDDEGNVMYQEIT